MWPGKASRSRNLRSAALLATVAVASCGSQVAEIRPYSSPAGTYEVTLRGDFDRPHHVWSRSHVNGVVSKARNQYVDLGELSQGNYIDDSFDEQYRSYRWVGEDILQFFHGTNNRPCDVLSLRNEAGVDLMFVTVHVDDLIVAIDLKPGTTKLLPISPSYDPAEVFIQAQTQFTSGGQRLSQSMTVKRRAQRSRNGFQVSITSGGILIGSYEVPSSQPVVSGPSCASAPAR
jgi:hypothetical protein